MNRLQVYGDGVCNNLLDNRWELCDLLGECYLLVGLKVITFGECACLFKNTAGTGMGILDVRPALALEIQRLLPVKDRYFSQE